MATLPKTVQFPNYKRYRFQSTNSRLDPNKIVLKQSVKERHGRVGLGRFIILNDSASYKLIMKRNLNFFQCLLMVLELFEGRRGTANRSFVRFAHLYQFLNLIFISFCIYFFSEEIINLLIVLFVTNLFENANFFFQNIKTLLRAYRHLESF